MGNFGMGSNWLKGPYYPSAGWGRIALTPVSRLPLLGTAGAVIAAGRTGYAIGSYLDNRYKFSDNLSSFAANRTSSSVKWWIHKHF